MLKLSKTNLALEYEGVVSLALVRATLSRRLKIVALTHKRSHWPTTSYGYVRIEGVR